MVYVIAMNTRPPCGYLYFEIFCSLMGRSRLNIRCYQFPITMSVVCNHYFEFPCWCIPPVTCVSLRRCWALSG